jgi:hypothetical protein
MTPQKELMIHYRQYEEEQFAVLEQSESLINQFSGDEIVSKFEFLKANTIGKLRGLGSYKKHYSLWWIIKYRRG